jgi:hypothetical protein
MQFITIDIQVWKVRPALVQCRISLASHPQNEFPKTN